MAINYRKNELEQKMLLNLHKKTWTHGLTLKNFNTHSESNEKAVKVRPDLFLYLNLESDTYILDSLDNHEILGNAFTI